MKLPSCQSDEASLAQLGAEVARLLKEEKHAELAARFGYALARGKDPARVIQSEVTECFWRSARVVGFSKNLSPAIVVKYFEPNDTGLFALVECTVPLLNGVGGVLAELVVTTMGNDRHVFLEQISYAAGGPRMIP
jgi:hypothetical protein